MTSDRGRDNGLSIGWLVGFGRRSISRQCDRVGRSSPFAADVTEVSVRCRSNLCRTMDSAERNAAPQGYSFVRLFLCHSVLWICSGNKSSDWLIYLLSYRCRPELKTNKLQVGGRMHNMPPPLSSLCGRRSVSRRRADRACRPQRSSRFPRSIRSHFGSPLQLYPTVTAAAAWRVNAAVSKAAWWPWPLTFWPKWCPSHLWRGLSLCQF